MFNKSGGDVKINYINMAILFGIISIILCLLDIFYLLPLFIIPAWWITNLIGLFFALKSSLSEENSMKLILATIILAIPWILIVLALMSISS
jgi:hypothetical protein